MIGLVFEGVEELPRTYRVISVDDHLCEPPDMFDGRLPEKFQDRAPRLVDRGFRLALSVPSALRPVLWVNLIVAPRLSRSNARGSVQWLGSNRPGRGVASTSRRTKTVT